MPKLYDEFNTEEARKAEALADGRLTSIDGWTRVSTTGTPRCAMLISYRGKQAYIYYVNALSDVSETAFHLQCFLRVWTKTNVHFIDILIHDYEWPDNLYSEIDIPRDQRTADETLALLPKLI